MNRKSTDHVVMVGDSNKKEDPFRVQCRVCGERFVVVMGTEVGVGLRGMKAFVAMHAGCAPAAPPAKRKAKVRK